MANISEQLATLSNRVSGLQNLISGQRVNPLVYSAFGQAVFYGCKVTQGSSASDYEIALEGAASGDSAHTNPDIESTPLYPFQSGNIASTKAAAFYSGDLSAIVELPPTTGTGRYDIAYIAVGPTGPVFGTVTGAPSAGVRDDFIANGLSTGMYDPLTDAALPVGALPVARIYVEDDVTGIPNERIADLRVFGVGQYISEIITIQPYLSDIEAVADNIVAVTGAIQAANDAEAARDLALIYRNEAEGFRDDAEAIAASGLVSAVNNGLVFVNSSGAITSSSALQFDGAANYRFVSASYDPFSRFNELNYTLGAVTASHNMALNINGGASAGRGALLEMGTGGTRYFSLSSNAAESRLGTTTNLPLVLQTNDTGRVWVTSAGVGINNSSPSCSLDVAGSGSYIRVSEVAQDDGFEAGWSSGGNLAFVQAYDRLASQFRALSVNGSDVRVGIAGSEVARFTSAGFVIGATSATTKFDVAVNGPSGQAKSVLIGGANQATPSRLEFFATGLAGASSMRTGINAVSDANAIIALQINGNEIGRVSAGGLSVRAATSLLSNTSTTGSNAVRVSNTNTGGTLITGIDNSTGTALFGVGGYVAGIWYNGNHPLVFATNNTERVRITEDGRFVVGGTVAAAKIHAVSSGEYSLAGSGASKGVRFAHDSVRSSIDGVDSTLSASYQPLAIGGSQLEIHVSGDTAAIWDGSKNFIQTLNASAPTLVTNSTMTFELTDNTTLSFVVKGTDGTVRSGSVTLS